MSAVSAIQSGIAGIQTGMNAIRKDAQVIASQSVANGGDMKNVTDAIIDMKSSQRQVESSAKVLQVQDEILGTLLDEIA